MIDLTDGSARPPAPRLPARRSRPLKRAFDLVVAIPLCVAIIPVLLIFAVVLAVQLRAWPFFVHERIGKNGRIFRMPKLRTLPRHTPPNADKTQVKLVPPSRFARFLRRSHLDELPQLFLVPVGTLSLVGPRPRMPAEAAAHGEASYAMERTSVAQGCTGLWQVSEHYHLRVSDSPEYDLYYVREGSFALDLWVLWRTAAQVFGAKGVTLAQVPRFGRPGAAVAPAEVVQ